VAGVKLREGGVGKAGEIAGITAVIHAIARKRVKDLPAFASLMTADVQPADGFARFIHHGGIA
jgi:hypothetical protein